MGPAINKEERERGEINGEGWGSGKEWQWRREKESFMRGEREKKGVGGGYNYRISHPNLSTERRWMGIYEYDASKTNINDFCTRRNTPKV